MLARPDGSEYFLLENRKKKGFDQSLPAEGLLIWRVVQNRPILEESHGVEGPSGPRVFLEFGAVPKPGERRVHAVHDAVEPSANSAAACRSTSPTSADSRTAGLRFLSDMNIIELVLV